MTEQANKIQLVINTLETLSIPATYDNLNKLLGCMQVLRDVMKEVGESGNDHAD